MKTRIMIATAALAAMLALVGCGGRQCGCHNHSQVGTVEPNAKGDGEIYRISTSLPIDYSEEMEWVLRYDDNDVEALRQRAQSEQKECDVLFFGSSSIRLWSTLAEDMAPLRVVNRGYGGAMMRDVHYNYHTILADYSPRAFVFYCDNDLGGFGRDLHPTELFDLYRLLVERLQRDYPERPIFILSIKFNNNRIAKIEQHRLFNAIMSDYAAHTEGVTFVDVNTPILHPDGTINDAMFEPDLLHVNRKGYSIWASTLRPLLIEALK